MNTLESVSECHNLDYVHYQNEHTIQNKCEWSEVAQSGTKVENFRID